jgi:dihydrofolate reductase
MGGVATIPWMSRSLWSAARSHNRGSSEGSPFTFVTDGLERALEQATAVAGGKDVGVGAASIVQQCIRAGLLDELHLDLVPVLLGAASACSTTSAPGRSTWSARG